MIKSAHGRTIIDSKPMVFSHLLYTGRFVVPWHQRRYDWEKENVFDLLHDIDEALKENRKCYFLGSIMLVKKEDGLWEINDGQQRMVTFSLICACLCRLFSDGSKESQESLALHALFDVDRNDITELSDTDELEPRLTPPRNDKTRYNLMIRGKSIGTNGKLTDAWREIQTFVSGMGLDKSLHFFDFLINKIEISCLYIPNSLDPNSVYETINNRGKHLDDLDLIRNHIYSFFNANEEAARQDTVHDSLEGVSTQLREDRRMSDYVRCYFQCKYGFLPKDSFYRDVRVRIRDMVEKFPAEKKPADYVYQLVGDFASREFVELFHKIANPGVGDAFVGKFIADSRHGGDARNLQVFLRELQNYKITQPIIFALLSRYVKEKDKIKKKRLAARIHDDINCITSFVMRIACIAPKFESSKFESEFSALAEKIFSTDSAYDVSDFLKECDTAYGIIENKKFIDKMKFVEMRSASKIKRLLLSLNTYEQSDGDIIKEYRCTIEHILPKSTKHLPGWWQFDEQTHKEYVHRLGNLTLLGQHDNRSAASENRSFEKKQESYNRSAVLLTKKVSEYDYWSPQNIDERQEKLAVLAAKVWELKL